MTESPCLNSLTPEQEVENARKEMAALAKDSYRAAGKDCDMIMKGGITSGVVYPLTVCKVATQYQLRGIGGTSAGAIAAALAAAAEYRRQNDTTTPEAGFQRLAGLPEELAPRLNGLFQPHPQSRGIFAVLHAAIDAGHHGVGKVVRVLAAVIRNQTAWFVGGVVLVAVVVLPGLVIAGGLPIEGRGWARLGAGLVLPAALALATGLLFAAFGLARSALSLLPERDFGLTDGATHQAAPALTQWLSEEIDEVAGKAGGVLTLGDLWGPEACAAWARLDAQERKFIAEDGPIGRVKMLRTIDLQVMTTNLTEQRPYRLPLTQRVFLFDAAEMRALFPGQVVDVMATPEAETGHVNPRTGSPLYTFPEPAQLPVVVMARMSLSFPGLISAVPLYKVDRGNDFSVVRHLFSDGGLSSNFPMHFFDSLLPRRPTFGINLGSPHPRYGTRPWRPMPTGGGILPRARPFATMAGFVGALKGSMQNWADNVQVTQRGYADRVVEIPLSSSEGGMNLDMPTDTIYRLVSRGAQAGDSLLGFDWEAHRVIRYRTAMVRLNEALDSLRGSWLEGEYADLLASYPEENRPASSFLGSATWRTRDAEATGELLAVAEGWEASGWPALTQDGPSSIPVIRMAPE